MWIRSHRAVYGAGSDAAEIGLVDGIGTIKDAIMYAAGAAGNGMADLSAWQIVEYPKADDDNGDSHGVARRQQRFSV